VAAESEILEDPPESCGPANRIEHRLAEQVEAGASIPGDLLHPVERPSGIAQSEMHGDEVQRPGG